MDLLLMLAYIPETQQLETPERTTLHQTAQRIHIERAINLAKSNSATGTDGCPYELWKKLKERYDADTLENSSSQSG